MKYRASIMAWSLAVTGLMVLTGFADVVFEDNFDATAAGTYVGPTALPGWTYAAGGDVEVFDLGGGNHAAGISNSATASLLRQYKDVSGNSELDIRWDMRFMSIRPQRDTFTQMGISLRPLPYTPEKHIKLYMFGDSSFRLYLRTGTTENFDNPLASYTYTGDDILQEGEWQSMRLTVDIPTGTVKVYNVTKSGNGAILSYTDANLFDNGGTEGKNIKLFYIWSESGSAPKQSLGQYDNIVVYDAIVVPLPASAGLIGAGMLLLGLMRLRYGSHARH